MSAVDAARERAEVIECLNTRDAEHQRRRRQHHLPRELYTAEAGIAFCVTICARHHGEPFQDDVLNQEIIDSLRFYRDRGDCLVFVHCLMPDHLHFMAQMQNTTAPQEGDSPPPDLLRLVANLKRYTTTQVAWKHGLHGQLWQRDFYDRAPRGRMELDRQCRYILENPVRKDLAATWEEYRWCGIMDRWW